MRLPTTLAALSLCLNGCLSVTATQLGPPRQGYLRASVPADQVSVYRSADQVEGDYVEVALLHATGPISWTTETGMIRKLREEAGRLGANAIILEPERELTVREKIAIEKSNVDIGRDGRAVAIYVRPWDGAAGTPGSDSTGDAETAPPAAVAPPPAAVDASYVVILEDGLVLPVDTVEPWGVGQVRVTRPDGSTRFLSSSRIRSITDRSGEDVTARALDERRTLPRTTATF
jgi:hypothetical protein